MPENAFYLPDAVLVGNSIQFEGNELPYDLVYDSLETLWEDACGMHVDDDGGFAFENWLKINPGLVTCVLRNIANYLEEVAV